MGWNGGCYKSHKYKKKCHYKKHCPPPKYDDYCKPKYEKDYCW